VLWKKEAIMKELMQKCIDQCAACALTCMTSIRHCLEKGGRHADPRHIGLMVDCMTLCEASVKLMVHHSEYQYQLCTLCAEVCDRCEEDCRSFEDDASMQKCADACRSCAEACRDMVAVRRAA
jgi:hypothetical protein